MLRWAVFLLLIIPLVDILLLIYVAGFIGAPATVAIVVLTGLIGLLLVRAEGRNTLRRIQQKAARGDPPTDELLDGGLLIASGAFLLTPGLVTDGIGFLLVVPPSRYLIRTALKRWIVVPIMDARSGGFVTGNVYVGGFPNQGSGGGSTGPEVEEEGTVDLDRDAYDIDLDEGDEENGNP